MPKITVGQLKEMLDDYGDHLPVVLALGGMETEAFSVEAATDSSGEAACVLESD